MTTEDQQAPAQRVFKRTKPVPSIQLVTSEEILLSFGIGRATLQQWEAQRGFPAPLNFGFRSLRWRLQEVEAGLEAQRELVNAAVVVDSAATDAAAKEIPAA